MVLTASSAKKIIKTILHRKYPVYCPEEYVKKVIDSVIDDPVKLRDFRYLKKSRTQLKKISRNRLIPLIVNDNHHIHHIRERGIY